MRIFNSMTNKKEEFIPIEEGKVSIYACGPTVYNYFHIGNARPFITFDVLRKYFEYKGYKVTFIQNFTDIDDKIIKKANELNISYEELSKKYIDEYFKDASALGIEKATYHPLATENIEGMIEMIQTLIDKGYAYVSEGDVYFRTKKFKEYGKLSMQPLEDLEKGARIDVSEKKEDAMDFALWKRAKDNEPYWEAPWGKGRPGWHIECSVMANKYLGKTIDIHCGGKDLIFPHHENEIAQSECANDKEFARYWMHNGFINVDNQKMAKSKGNFFTVRDAAAEYGYDAIRFFMLMSHYRSPINYAPEILKAAKAGLERIQTCAKNIEFVLKTAGEDLPKKDFSIYRERFIEAMDDDLNTADAVSVIFDLVKDINTMDQSSKEDILNARKMLYELCGVLNIRLNADEDISLEVEKLIEERNAAKREKNYAKADEIRNKLKEMNIVIEDTKDGVRWRKI